MSNIPVSVIVSFGVITPSISPAIAVAILNVEPGAILVCVALFTRGVDLSARSEA